ncbi:hypothetical protein GN244_ATG03194 [Phytophthora infestans]|uniref:Uncharacterized protein n=1 Tax=Phytophthora infestans TaxID=4787 RepID=A0A833TJK3_PHYIN|nr:hypothetical protein GN244_ATG03194 [Phytophthora infestans]
MLTTLSVIAVLVAKMHAIPALTTFTLKATLSYSSTAEPIQTEPYERFILTRLLVVTVLVAEMHSIPAVARFALKAALPY